MIKINLACGNMYDESWMNIDSSLINKLLRFPKLVKFLEKKGVLVQGFYEYNFVTNPWCKNAMNINLKKDFPFITNYANYIFCSHFLEHLTPHEGTKFLKECYRILQPKGVLRITVPDLEFFSKSYVCHQDAVKMNELFYRNNYWEYTDEKQHWIEKLFSKPNQHQWNYDFALLKKTLESVGFIDINKCNTKEGKCPDLAKLDHVGMEHLIVEAEKP